VRDLRKPVSYRAFALDAKTATSVSYAHRLPDDILLLDVVNRGAAIYGDNGSFGTLDAGVGSACEQAIPGKGGVA